MNVRLGTKWRRGLIVAAISALGLAALAAIGEALATPWQALPYTAPALSENLSRERPVAQTPADASRTDHPVRREEIMVPVRGTSLPATVFAPTTPGQYPAVAFVHGAGSGDRGSFFSLAEDFARAGIVALAYDKRGDYSYLGNRDFDQLAEDAIGVVAALRQRSDVDPERAGLWGLSEGGRVVPLAASRSQDVGFAIIVSGAVRSPLRNTAWSVHEGLSLAQAPSGARRLAVQVFGGGYLFTLPEDPPATVWENVTQPVLAVYGTADTVVPPAESSRGVVDGLLRGGNNRFTVRYFADADHGLMVGDVRAPGYVQATTDWITGLPDTPSSTGDVAGLEPTQRFATTLVPRAPWYGGLHALVATIVVSLAGALIVPLMLGRRAAVGADPSWSIVERRSRWAAIGGTATFVMLWAYIGVLIALGHTRTGSPALLGIGWGAVRLAAVTTVIVTVHAAFDLWRFRSVGGNSTPAQRVLLLGRLSTTGLLLLSAAYWGLFGPRW